MSESHLQGRTRSYVTLRSVEPNESRSLNSFEVLQFDALWGLNFLASHEHETVDLPSGVDVSGREDDAA